MPTVGSVAGVTLVIWPFDHEPPHLHAYAGGAPVEIAIATGNVIDKPSSQAPPAAQARLVQGWIAENRDELQTRWQQLQP